MYMYHIHNEMDDSNNVRKCIILELNELMNGVNVAGHNYDHFIAVRDHAIEALKHEIISDRKKLQVELAALLHDVDDRKLFPNNKVSQSDSRKSQPYDREDNVNARMILEKSIKNIEDADEFIEGIIVLINLVACSKNGDSEPPKPWMAIPRDCDRLEAIGQIGIDRCRDLCIQKKYPFHLDSTPRAYDHQHVLEAATSDRFNAYMKGTLSVSMIDHYYDKLLHIGNAKSLRSQNPYILEEAARRNDSMVQFVIDYWKNNK